MSGAYRDTGAAIARAEALEREVEELRAELATLKRAAGERRPSKEPARAPRDVVELESALVDARAENELLRSQLAHDIDSPKRIKELERELRTSRSERDDLARRLDAIERTKREGASKEDLLADLEAERSGGSRDAAAARAEIDQRRATLTEQSAARATLDSRAERLQGERDELRRELLEARERYEAEPPASRDPRRFEEKVRGILGRILG